MGRVTDSDGVRILSRRMVRPSSPAPTAGNGHRPPKDEVEEIHLTPWDLRLLTVDYIQKGILLPKPPVAGDRLLAALAASLAAALGRFHLFAGRLAAEERGDGTVTVSLRCTGEGAELVHAAAPAVAVADIAASLYTPPVAWSLYQLNEVLNADAAVEPHPPVLSVQVTELADGVFIGVSMNHSVGDGTTFWDFFNTWSAIHRSGGIAGGDELSAPAPVHRRWFLEGSPVPIPLPFGKLQHAVRRFERTPVQECFFTISGASVGRLKARANGEMAGAATAEISSLQSVLAHLWRAVCRARRLPPEQRTLYSLLVGCRGRVGGVPAAGYVGNAVVFGRAEAPAGEVEAKGLGWTAWLLNRAVASFDEARMREALGRWARQPEFTYAGELSGGGTAVLTGSSPRFDVFGNDFGWGRPAAVRSGPGNKVDGKATVFEAPPEKGGGMSLEVCIAPEALARLVADEEFMDAVTVPS
ncbi:hypothetical protein ACP4OV_011782 [Aristida adscensionis]